MKARIFVPAIALFLATACQDTVNPSFAPDASNLVSPDASAADASGSTSVSSVRFDLSSQPLPLGAVPFPSDLYRDARGRIEIGALPGSANPELLQGVRDALAVRSGFCTTCNVVFEIEGGLAADSVPESRHPAESASLDDPIVLLDVDPTSKAYGHPYPLRVQWDESTSRLAIRPVRGSVLEPGRRHVAVLTNSVRGEDDLPLSPSPQFEAARDGQAASGVDEVLRPALEELDRLGIDRDAIVGLAAFTTDDPLRDLRTIREEVHAAPAPVAVVDRVWSGAEIDDLLGIPAQTRPGIDVPPVEGTEGTAAIVHDTTAHVISGHFPAPRFVEGESTALGLTTRDSEGRPVPNGTDRVPFVLIVPRLESYANVPVLVVQHGFSASRTTGFALADTAGRAGYAVLAIDAFQHGARAPSAKDREHAMRGELPGPDGFAEAMELDVIMRMFGITGVPTSMRLFPGYPLAAFLQCSADVVAAVRMIREGDIAELRASADPLAELGFDRQRVAFLGNSMGAVIGTGVLAVETNISAAILNVLPGSIVEVLAESPEFRPMVDRIFLPVLGVDASFDEVQRSLLFDPVIDLLRWVLEPVDPLALSGYLVEERDAGKALDLLVQLASHDEVAPPAPTQSAVAAAGISAHGTFHYADVEPLSLPASRNHEGSTVGAVIFEPAMHGMLEVLEQDSKWAAPLLPPLTARGEPQRIVNPIVAVHNQIETFLNAQLEEGHGQIDE